MRWRITVTSAAALATAYSTVLVAQTPMGTVFNYQGRLTQAGLPVHDKADFEFRLFDAATTPPGGQVGATVTLNDRDVVNGMFTVKLDFGAIAFDGDARWLDVAVRVPAGVGSFIPLSPRQAVDPAPYAIFAETAGGPCDGHSLDAADGAPTDALYVDNDGKVGIGTTTPGAILEAAGTVLANRFQDRNNTSFYVDPANEPTSAVLKGQLGIRGAPFWGGIMPGWGPDLHINSGNEIATAWIGGSRSTAGDDIGYLSFPGLSGGFMTPVTYAAMSGKIQDSSMNHKGALLFHTISPITLPSGGGLEERMRITWQGRVGIGTTTPAETLDVEGTVRMTGFAMPTGAGDGLVLTSDASGNGTWQTSAGDISGTGNANRIPRFTGGKTIGNSLLYASDDYVGLGTTTPGFRFQIDGGATTAGKDAVIYLNAQWNPEIYLHAGGGSADGKIHFENGAREWLIINDGSEDRLDFRRIGSVGNIGTLVSLAQVGGGRVGIKTTSPMGTLDVNGSIYQRGGLLHADYVFEPGYQLESIEDHAGQMWSDKHLPAIPKARRAPDGQEIVELGARQRGTLEELEKAHIYIEQLHNRVSTLEERLARLEAATAQAGPPHQTAATSPRHGAKGVSR